MPTGYAPASILYISIAGRYWPVSYPDGPITVRYRPMLNAYWDTPLRVAWLIQTDLEIALTYHNLSDNPSYLPRKHRQQLCLTCHFLSSSAAASHMTRCMEPYSYNCLKILKLFNHEINKQQITLFSLSCPRHMNCLLFIRTGSM